MKSSEQRLRKEEQRKEYLAERKRREYIRKAARKQKQRDSVKYKKRGPFCKCGASAQSLDLCPFDYDMNGIQSYCNCCGSCRHDCAMDI